MIRYMSSRFLVCVCLFTDLTILCVRVRVLDTQQRLDSFDPSLNPSYGFALLNPKTEA